MPNSKLLIDVGGTATSVVTIDLEKDRIDEIEVHNM